MFTAARFTKVLLVVLVVIIGFTSWFVYHAKQESDKTLASNKQNQETFAADQAVNSARVAYTTYIKAMRVAREAVPTATQAAGLPVIKDKLAPSVYDEFVRQEDQAISNRVVYKGQNTPGANAPYADQIICANEPIIYNDYPVRATLSRSDDQNAIVRLIMPVYDETKKTYDYNRLGSLFTVNLATQRITAISCETQR